MLKPESRQRGFSMIEVLVTVAVLSIGLLGYAGLQILGVRSNQGSYMRSQAAALTQELAERIHLNSTAANAGDYDAVDSDASGIDCDSVPAICDEFRGTQPTNCTPAQMASFDVWVTYCGYPGSGGSRIGGLKDLLLNGRLELDCANPGACLAGDAHTITTSWQVSETDSDGGVDMDGDGDFNFMTVRFILTFTP